EKRLWSGVGLFYSRKEGFKHHNDLKVFPATGWATPRLDPRTGNFVMENTDLVTTAAHFFYDNGKLIEAKENLVFAVGDFETGQIFEYEIADIVVGTKYPDSHQSKDMAVVRLKQRLPDWVRPLPFKIAQQQPDLVSRSFTL